MSGDQINIGKMTGSNLVTGHVSGNVSSSGSSYESLKKQTLAEAAAEIQRLLKQLEETNPNATESEQIAYVNIATKSDLRQRTVAALREGGETAIDELILENKYLKIAKAVVKGWLHPKN